MSESYRWSHPLGAFFTSKILALRGKCQFSFSLIPAGSYRKAANKFGSFWQYFGRMLPCEFRARAARVVVA